MSLFTALTSATTLEEAFRAKDCTSQRMKVAIEEWFALYFNRKATKDSDPCQRIAYTVVNKLDKTCFGEYNANSKDEYAQSVLDALDKSKHEAMQMLLAGGEAFLKPLPINKTRWIFTVIRRDNVLVFGRDVDGVPCDIGTIERTTGGNKFYTLLERRTVDTRGYLTIRNILYCSTSSDNIGTPVSLQSLERYEELAKEYTYTEPLGNLGLVYLRTPIANTVDGTKDGVSVYSAAVGLIHNIDHNEALINGEFDRGQSRLIVSDTMLRRNPQSGKREIGDNIFVGVAGDPEDVGVTAFAPDLREEAFLTRKREYLRNVESVIGIKRGLLSDVESEAKTATEITSSAGDYNLTIIDLQGVWTNAAKEAVRLCGILGKLYDVKGAHEVAEDAVTIDWGNGILYDEEKAWADYKDMVARGLIKPEIALGWRFNMPCDTDAELAKIRKKYMPELEQMLEDGEE